MASSDMLKFSIVRTNGRKARKVVNIQKNKSSNVSRDKEVGNLGEKQNSIKIEMTTAFLHQKTY